MHLKRLRRSGTVDGGDRTMESPLIRFWKKVDIRRGGCWLWTAGVDEHGYGRFKDDHREASLGAHRWAYTTFIGDIPEGLTIDHLCRIRNCVNPFHLEAVTNRENVLRGVGPSAENGRKTHCPVGHAYDEENTLINHRGSRECLACRQERERLKSKQTRQ